MTVNLATGSHAQFGVGGLLLYGLIHKEIKYLLLIFSTNHIDYPICIWAVQRLCAIISFVKAGSRSHSTLTVLISPCNPMSTVAELSCQLVQTKASLLIAHEKLLGRQIGPGEGATKIALLCPSSGTTGLPKIVAIPHFAVIANVLQIAAQNRVNEEYTSWRERRWCTGNAGGKSRCPVGERFELGRHYYIHLKNAVQRDPCPTSTREERRKQTEAVD
ncbi:hypothetical protein B0H14DRAFT_2617221 [Mycena olivaceomarginata]|nr:hypothetical protein B0H14DRAFT_2617221 [Mycena olivaceomarginata]